MITLLGSGLRSVLVANDDCEAQFNEASKRQGESPDYIKLVESGTLRVPVAPVSFDSFQDVNRPPSFKCSFL
jgi:hypothetical protein